MEKNRFIGRLILISSFHILLLGCVSSFEHYELNHPREIAPSEWKKIEPFLNYSNLISTDGDVIGYAFRLDEEIMQNIVVSSPPRYEKDIFFWKPEKTTSFLKRNSLNLAINSTPYTKEKNKLKPLGVYSVGSSFFNPPQNGYGYLCIQKNKNQILEYSLEKQSTWEKQRCNYLAVGGYSLLIANGESLNHDSSARHPRSAIALDAKNRLLLVAIDGRLYNHSIGVTLNELTKWLQKLGAVSALNLDGGGSTSLVYSPSQKNHKIYQINKQILWKKRKVVASLGFEW